MRTVVTKIYNFDELSPEAQETAIETYRNSEGYLRYEWWEFVFEDAKEIANLFGLEIDDIYFSGFWSQGDGACFTGTYAYAKGGLQKVKEYCPTEVEVIRIARRLQVIQSNYFYNLRARVRHWGRYSHEYCTDIDVYYDLDETREILEVEVEITKLLRDYMRWIYKKLEEEYEYLTSDEVIREELSSNSSDFLEDGSFY